MNNLITTVECFVYFQDSLKKRMGHLKDTIEEASASVEKEKAKNVELLSTVFPTQIARELWLGKF